MSSENTLPDRDQALDDLARTLKSMSTDMQARFGLSPLLSPDAARQDQESPMANHEQQLMAHDGHCLLVPRVEFSSVFGAAKLLDLLVLLYDRVYWYEPTNTLLYPDELAGCADLHPYGVDKRFPDKLIEYTRQGIVVPIAGGAGRYSAPVESAQEMALWDSLLYFRTDDLIPYLHDNTPLLGTFRDAVGVLCSCEGLVNGDSGSGYSNLFRLLSMVLLTKGLNLRSVFVSNPREAVEWKALSGLCGRDLPVPKPDSHLPPLSLLRLFEGLFLLSPSRLSTDEVLGLREQVGTRHLREWLFEQEEKASLRVVATDPVDFILEHFNFLVEEAVARSNRALTFKVALGALAATLGTAVGGVPGAAVGAMAGVLAGVAAEKASAIWRKHYDALGWVLKLYEFRSRKLAEQERGELQNGPRGRVPF